MIVTVTMNPAIDKTVEIDLLRVGGLNRIQKVEYDAGGKGINVSKTIFELGGESLATGFLAGNAGRTIEAVLDEKKILHDFIWVEGETRTNTKVIETCGEVTELNEPGPVISEEQVEQLLQKLSVLANEQVLFVLAGSIPKGVGADIYARITQLVHEKGAKVLMDADGDLFRLALEAKPDIIKPNHLELKRYISELECKEEGVDDLFTQAMLLRKKGIQTIAISRGKDGALFLIGEKKISCPAIPVQAHSTVGAGDAMVAALSYSWSQQLDEEETVRLCMATSAGAVTTIGTKPPTREFVEQLKKKVILKEE